MCILRFICITFLFALISAPLVQFFVEPFPRVSLENIQIRRTMPELSASTLLSGKFQEKFATWFLRNHGLWGSFVKTSNQLNYSLFSNVSASYRSSVVMGDGHTLVQRTYVTAANGTALAPTKMLAAKVRNMAILQNFLHQHNKAFMLLISTNKFALYPEWFPNSLKTPFPPPRDIERMRPMLDANAISYIDGHAFLSALKADYEHPFFSKTGSHWNSVANCLVSKSLLENIASQLDVSMRSIECGPGITVKPFPVKKDRDLESMINVWSAAASLQPEPYIEVTSNKNAEVFKPRILFVGTSFLWALTELLEQQHAYTDRDMYFYGKNNYFYRGKREAHDMRGQVPVQYSGVNWREKLLTYDAVVLEANEGIISQIGFDFLKIVARQLTTEETSGTE
jgi:hypothetical protein